MTKCGGCKKIVPRGDIAKCAKCAKCAIIYHPYCLKGDMEARPATWLCPACAQVVEETIAVAPVSETGVSSPGLPELVVAEDRLNSTANDTTEEFKVELGLEIRLFRQELTAAREEIQMFRTEVKELKNSFTETNNRLNALDSRVDLLEQRLTDGTGSRLESIIADLRVELNEKDQELLENDVEITNLNEENGENPTHLILSVAAKLGLNLNESDVVSAERVGARKGWSRAPGEDGKGAGAGAGRPRPLVVRLSRRALKDDLITAARVRRGATSADLGQSSAPRPFFVNERLTKINRQLFYQVREIGRRQSWRFLWTKKGRIYARQAQDTPRQWIRTSNDNSCVWYCTKCRDDNLTNVNLTIIL
ncbi:hypothetical protein JYU34_005908 [Plutella xylostella]|uniref:FP protein C-terminal domain-containing protein n=1 Tax=Plutella xylostella TaxID=51655 RepID=A0ABQ7QUG4_PLUXY|nr:hypothetical protein JYU34_005908 [Plutella xylostella]